MKSNGKIALLILLIGLFLCIGMTVEPGQAQTQPPDNQATAAQRTITVTGTGRAGTQPDVAVLQVGVRTDADTAQEALTENNQQMQALLDALDDAGIAQENIQTSFVQLQPRYNQPTGDSTAPLEVIGYTAVNLVEVRLEQIDRVGEVVDAAVSAGGNTIDGIRFEISDPSGLYAEAMEAAMEDARLKAEQLAGFAGVELGDILSISEGGFNAIPFAGGGALAQTDLAVPVEPGLQNITIQLMVTWAIEPAGRAGIPVTGGTSTPTRTPGAVTATTTPTRPAPAATATPTREPSGSSEPMDFESLVEALEALNANLLHAGEIEQPFFPVAGQVLRVNGAVVQVFEFPDTTSRRAVSDTISESGDILGAVTPSWSERPNFWAQGRLIVLYLGEDQDVIDVLSQALGDPITEASSSQGIPPLAALQAQSNLAERLNIPADRIEILSYEREDWPNACLGLASKGEACADVVIPGWFVVLRAGGQRYEAHTDWLGEAIRWVDLH